MQGTRDKHAGRTAADLDYPGDSETSTWRLLEMLNQALRWPDDKFQHCYQNLVAQIERDCRQQEEWLELLPSALSRQHLEEHARMLGVMHHTALCVMQGNIAIGRTAVFLLADWIRVHADTMDRPLADALRKKRLSVRHCNRARNDLIDIG